LLSKYLKFTFMIVIVVGLITGLLSESSAIVKYIIGLATLLGKSTLVSRMPILGAWKVYVDWIT